MLYGIGLHSTATDTVPTSLIPLLEQNKHSLAKPRRLGTEHITHSALTASTKKQSLTFAKMLLEEDPATLLRHTISNFSTQPDRAAVSRINESLSTLQQSRELRLNDAETALRKLSRQLATVSSQHREATGSHDAQRHASEIVELDTKKFRVAKQAQELEVEGERLDSELDRLRRRLEELEEQGVEGDAQARAQREADDPTVYVNYLERVHNTMANSSQIKAMALPIFRNHARTRSRWQLQQGDCKQYQEGRCAYCER